MCAVSQYEYFISSNLLASVWVWLSGQSLLSLGFPDSHELLCAPGPPGEDTLAPPDEPVPHVGVDLVLGQISRHQPLTELAVVGDTDVADHLVVGPPGEVGGATGSSSSPPAPAPGNSSFPCLSACGAWT